MLKPFNVFCGVHWFDIDALWSCPGKVIQGPATQLLGGKFNPFGFVGMLCHLKLLVYF
jgi:hypothetical protein